VLNNGTLYLLADDQNNGSESYTVYAINASDGTIRWHTSIEASAQLLQVADGVVYTGTSAGVIFARNASNGSIRWQTKVGNSEADVWQISNGVVYASLVKGGPHTESGSLYALNTADGSVRWHAQPRGMPTTIRVGGGQVDMVAISSQDGSDPSTVSLTPTFYALDASTGAQRWSYVGSVSESMNMAGADANAVYLTTSQTGSALTTLLALNAGDGSVRWQKSVTGQDLSASVLPDNTMYLAFQGGVSAVNLLDGSEIWNHALSGPCFLRLLVDGTLYVTAGSTLFALDSSNGLVKWRYQAPNPGIHAAVNGVLYGSSVQVDTQQQRVQSSIFALDTSSGKQLWKYDIASAITVPVVG
jgi:eukaryotic-like serine/threonine-protein kinase